MKLRIARHTNDLKSMQDFYLCIPGMEVLGEFKDHQGYAGVFIGIKNDGWHLEFTVSEDQPVHTPDEDDLLVFYPASSAAYHAIIDRLREKGTSEAEPKNPFWADNGITFLDPDGFRIVIASFK